MVGLVIAVIGWAGQVMAAGADGSTYVLTSFDGSFTLMGLNDQGRSFQAVYGSTTSFKQAVLDKSHPQIPAALSLKLTTLLSRRTMSGPTTQP